MHMQRYNFIGLLHRNFKTMESLGAAFMIADSHFLHESSDVAGRLLRLQGQQPQQSKEYISNKKDFKYRSYLSYSTVLDMITMFLETVQD
jgi:hypothetical protein